MDTIPQQKEEVVMRKRYRNKDKYQVGRSSLVPYIASESWQERHRRRMQHAMDNKEKVQAWCDKHKWILRVNNNGHHWIFLTKEKKMIEWWPSSGKIAIGKKWKEGIHCHDYKQLLKVLEMAL
jgi:hypothetical protein